MTHPLDEAIGEAQRQLRNAIAMKDAVYVSRFFGGPTGASNERAQAEYVLIIEKWTRIEKALVEARAKLSNG